MDMSFREKSLWLLLLGLIAAFWWYFASVLPARPLDVGPEHVMTFIGMLVVLVTVQVVGQTVLAIAGRGEIAAHVQSDERDARISLKSTRLAGYVLSGGVFVSLCVALIVPGNFAFAHTLLAFWALAQAVEILTQLILYRRGV